MSSACEQCHTEAPAYDMVSLSDDGGRRDLCTRCFNRETAADLEIPWEDPVFEPVQLLDGKGREHTFHIRPWFCAVGLELEAFEIVKGERGGYEFAVLDEFTADPMTLFAQLYERMRRALSRQHIEKVDGVFRLTNLDVIRGRIECDLDFDPRLPKIVIDGQAISWKRFGQMLMIFEGWQFRLEIVDRTDEA